MRLKQKDAIRAAGAEAKLVRHSANAVGVGTQSAQRALRQSVINITTTYGFADAIRAAGAEAKLYGIGGICKRMGAIRAAGAEAKIPPSAAL